MNREIELKFRLPHPDGLRERLRAHRARCAGRHFEVNRLFDTPERRLAARGCVLRIRSFHHAAGDTPPAVMTFKGPREDQPIKVREELETDVADPEVLARVLLELGLREVIRYEKKREIWQLDVCEVVIDRLPDLGTFGEIEGPSVAAVRQARTALGIDEQHLVHESYVDLAARHGRPGADGLRVLAFADRELD